VIPSRHLHLDLLQQKVAKIGVFSALFKLMLVKEDMEVLQKASDEEGRWPGGGSLGSGWTRVPPGLGETGLPKGRVGEASPPPMSRGPAKAGIPGNSPGPGSRP
jgi:hypothetical protein